MHSRVICFAGRRLAVLATPPQILERSTGIAPVLPDWRSGVLLLYELRLERAARVELASSGWRPEAPAAVPCSLQQTLAVATGVEPVPPDRQSGILPLDSATTFNFGCEGRIRTCMNRVRAGDPGQLNDLATLRREQSVTVFSWKEK